MTVFPGEESELLKSLGIGMTSGWETHPLLLARSRLQFGKTVHGTSTTIAEDMSEAHAMPNVLELSKSGEAVLPVRS